MPYSSIKSLCRESAFLSPIYQPARQFLWRSRSTLKGYRIYLNHGRPDCFIHFAGGGIGDDLMCTVLCRELKKRGARKIVMISKRKELFNFNADIDEVIPPEDDLLRNLASVPGKLVVPLYHTRGHSDGAYDSPKEHILALMCRAAGITEEVELKPRFHLSEEEKKTGLLGPVQIAVQSAGTNFPTKDWFPERFQEVIDTFRKDITFVQIGGKEDPPLQGVIDERGNTFRETAAILHHSRLFLGLVGFFMHLARAVECPSAIVYGGREAPWQGGYGCNENIVNAPSCSPCWHARRCDYNMQCMDEISIPQVTAVVQKLLDRPRQSLPVDRILIN